MHDRHVPRHFHRSANWIRGEPASSLSGDTFDVHLDGTREILGTWPRSSAADLRLAVDAASESENGWRRLGENQRRRALIRAAERLADDPDPGRLVEQRLGLDEREIAVHVRGIERALVDLLVDGDARLERGPIASREGPLLFAPDWTEMWIEPARALFFALLRGRPVIWLSDGRAPMLGDALARACDELDPGLMSVVHDDTQACIRAALVEPGLAGVDMASMTDELEDGRDSRGLRRAPDTDLGQPIADDAERSSVSAGLESAFGAGVHRRRGPSVERRLLRNASLVVSAREDLEIAARTSVALAFSRAHALSGVRPGQVARVLCPARCFSRFTEALLDAIERDSDCDRPIALARERYAPHVERALSLGHDEGATALSAGRLGDGSGGRRTSPAGGAGGPLVFTNVEVRMRLAHLARPAPVLRLMRVADEAQGHRLAETLDHEVYLASPVREESSRLAWAGS